MPVRISGEILYSWKEAEIITHYPLNYFHRDYNKGMIEKVKVNGVNYMPAGDVIKLLERQMGNVGDDELKRLKHDRDIIDSGLIIGIGNIEDVVAGNANITRERKDGYNPYERKKPEPAKTLPEKKNEEELLIAEPKRVEIPGYEEVKVKPPRKRSIEESVKERKYFNSLRKKVGGLFPNEDYKPIKDLFGPLSITRDLHRDVPYCNQGDTYVHLLKVLFKRVNEVLEIKEPSRDLKSIADLVKRLYRHETGKVLRLEEPVNVL